MDEPVVRRRVALLGAQAGFNAVLPHLRNDSTVRHVPYLHGWTCVNVEAGFRQLSNYYNTTRLHSAIGFIAPKDRLEGRHQQIHAARDKKLEEARQRRKIARQKLTQTTTRNHNPTTPAPA